LSAGATTSTEAGVLFTRRRNLVDEGRTRTRAVGDDEDPARAAGDVSVIRGHVSLAPAPHDLLPIPRERERRSQSVRSTRYLHRGDRRARRPPAVRA
jgi:hypothetical protein